MLFHIAYSFEPTDREVVQERFKNTGALPPEGVAMHGRWHCAEGLAGFLLADAPDAISIARWTQQWTDLLSFEVTPVITDEEMMNVLG